MTELNHWDYPCKMTLDLVEHEGFEGHSTPVIGADKDNFLQLVATSNFFSFFDGPGADEYSIVPSGLD